MVFGLWHIAPTLESVRTHPAADDLSGKPLHIAASVAGIVAATAAAGVAFGFLRVRSRSVVAPVLVHAALNATAFGTARLLATAIN